MAKAVIGNVYPLIFIIEVGSPIVLLYLSNKLEFTDPQTPLFASSLIVVTETGVEVPGITAKFVAIPVVKSVKINAKTSP